MNFNKFGKTANLFDKSTAIVGERVLANSVTADEAVAHSDYIDITGVSKLTVSYKYTGTNFYFYSTKTNASIGHVNGYTADVPTGAKYCRINILKEDIDITMLNEGSEAFPYQPYMDWNSIPHYIMGTDTDTITTLPAVIYPNDTSITVGIKGQSSQSGTPSPSNPVDVLGTGERTAQLFNKSAAVNGKWLNVNTGAEEGTTSLYWLSEYMPVKSGTTYSFTNPDSSRRWYYDASKNPVELIAGNSYTPQSDGYIRITIANNKIDEFMLNSGSTALPYEPYGFEISISSANTTTPVYLGEVETTRNIKKLVLTGNESLTITNSTTEEGTKVFSFKFTTIGMTDILNYDKQMSSIPYPFFYSSHFKQKDNEGAYTDIKNGEVGANSIEKNTYNRYIIFGSSVYTTAADFKTYLQQQYAAGTPVTVWYVLATEETAVVNEPLMRIGDYVDTLSNVSIPCTAGENTLDVQTTVQPSEVTATFEGWHPVSAAHERENGQWD